MVERREEADADHDDRRPVEAHQEVRPFRQPVADQGRAGDDQGDRDAAGDHRQDVEHERQGPGLDDPAVPPEPVHDRDGVDEDVKGAGAGPEREHEAQGDHVEPAAAEDFVHRRHDDPVDRPVGEERREHVDDRVADVLDLGGAEVRRHVADGAGEGEDQRWHGEHGEERRFGSEAGHPVLQAGTDGRDDQPPDQVEDPLEQGPVGRPSVRGGRRGHRLVLRFHGFNRSRREAGSRSASRGPAPGVVRVTPGLAPSRPVPRPVLRPRPRAGRGRRPSWSHRTGRRRPAPGRAGSGRCRPSRCR